MHCTRVVGGFGITQCELSAHWSTLRALVNNRRPTPRPNRLSKRVRNARRFPNAHSVRIAQLRLNPSGILASQRLPAVRFIARRSVRHAGVSGTHDDHSFHEWMRNTEEI